MSDSELTTELHEATGSVENDECKWCNRLRNALPGIFALTVAGLFLFIGMDLLIGGRLSAFVNGDESEDTTDDVAVD